MKYYKLNNEVFAFEEDQLEFLKPEMVEMTADEVAEHLNPTQTIEQLAAEARLKRDRLLSDTQWQVLRHRDQLESGATTTLTSAQYSTLLEYRQSLRDVPEQAGFPSSIDWPILNT